MNILINCSNINIGGGIQVAHSFIHSIATNTLHKFTVVMSDALDAQLDSHKFGANFTFIKYSNKASAIKNITGKNEVLTKAVEDHAIDVVFSVFGPTYWKPKVQHVVGYAKPHYIYRESPFFNILPFSATLKLKVKKFFQLYDFKHNNNVIITENKDVSIKLSKILKGKEIHTVTNYYNQIFDSPENWDHSIKLPPFNGFTLLSVSANYPHKNLAIIPKVIKYLNTQYSDFEFRFVLTLSQGTLGEHLYKSIDDRIVYVGKTNIAQVPSLYSQADAVFLPTLLECFTATYPEGMRMERPILTSDLNFARGLCEEAALYFDALDPKDIGDKIFLLANDLGLRNALVDQGKIQLKNYDNYNERAIKYLDLITK